MKLVPHNKSLEKDEASLYKKISDYYENLGDHDDALISFQKAVDIGEVSVSALYKLGHLNDICHKPAESMKIYQKLLVHPSIRERKEFTQIIQQKFNTAQRFKSTQQLQSKRLSITSDDSHHPQSPINSPLNQLQQNTNQKSTDNVNTTATNTGEYQR
jgi:tetratricopeptide (TPR) repeat protein